MVPARRTRGTQLPHAAGIAWAAKMQKKSTVALATLDAAEIDAEDFHTGLNFAGVFRVPVIFVCLNDGKAKSPLTRSETMAMRALAYGIAGVRVDGGDFLAVAAAVRAAAERARRGEGATLIEAVLDEGEGGRGRRRWLGGWLASEKILDAAAAEAMRVEVEAEVRAAAGRRAADRTADRRRRHREGVGCRRPRSASSSTSSLGREPSAVIAERRRACPATLVATPGGLSRRRHARLPARLVRGKPARWRTRRFGSKRW